MLIETNGAGDGGGEAERAVGECSAAAAAAAAPTPPDPELAERPKRRRFTAEYKLEILKQADALTELGEIGALLRREGLYSSHLSEWRKARDEGALEGLARKRGRKPLDRRDREISELTRRAERAEAELTKAHQVIEIQGKLSALLEHKLGTEGAKESTER